MVSKYYVFEHTSVEGERLDLNYLLVKSKWSFSFIRF